MRLSHRGTGTLQPPCFDGQVRLDFYATHTKMQHLFQSGRDVLIDLTQNVDFQVPCSVLRLRMKMAP